MMNRLVLVVVCISVAANLFGQTEIKKVKPSDTDPLIATFNFDSNYVYLNPTVSARNVLVVYLPGSNSEPKKTEFFGLKRIFLFILFESLCVLFLFFIIWRSAVAFSILSFLQVSKRGDQCFLVNWILWSFFLRPKLFFFNSLWKVFYLRI